MNIRKAFLIIGVISLLMNSGGVASSDPSCSPCGPTYCKSKTHTDKALAAKKASLKNDGYPDRLIALLDRNRGCVAAIERGPDGFSLLVVQSNGDFSSIAWSEANKANLASKLEAGEIKEYFEVWTNNYFCCCPGDGGSVQQLCYKDRADYREDIDMNTSLALQYK